jgi:hypothetical protein
MVMKKIRKNHCNVLLDVVPGGDIVSCARYSAMAGTNPAKQTVRR